MDDDLPESTTATDIPQAAEPTAATAALSNNQNDDEQSHASSVAKGGQLVQDEVDFSQNDTAPKTPMQSFIKMESTSSATSTAASTKNESDKSTPKLKPNIPTYLLNKASRGKTTYLTMIHEAIVEIGDRTGSSVPAIQKFIKSKYVHLQNSKPKQFSAAVNNALKAGLKEERFLKVRCSYKINSAWAKKQKAMYNSTQAKKKAAEKKRKREIEKLRIEREKKKKKEKEEKEREMRIEKERKAALASTLKEEERLSNEKKVRFHRMMMRRLLGM